MNPEPYDFRKPVRLAPELHKLLQNWFQTSAALASRRWVKQLPVPLELSVGALEDWHAHKALAALPDGSIGQCITIGSVPSMLVLPRSLLLNLAGVMLGEDKPQSDRELTAVEEELADYFLVNHWLPYFRESWPGPSSSEGLDCQLLQREAQPQFSRLFAADEVLVKLPWQIHAPLEDGKGDWLFPRQALVQALTQEPETAPQDSEKDAAERKAQLVRTLPLSLECILGTAQIRLSELSRLQVGDVLLLDQRASDSVTAVAGGQQLFRGQAGRDGSWKAFRIASFIEK